MASQAEPSGNLYSNVTVDGQGRVHLGNTYNYISPPAIVSSGPASPPSPVFMLPFVRDKRFVGRKDILEQMEERFREARRLALKSQIAIEYAYSIHEKHPQTHVFWVYAANVAKFEQAYKEIADKLKIPGRDDPKAKSKKLVLDWLSDESHGSWLMILDNADDRSLFFPKIDSNTPSNSNTETYLADYLPPSSNEHGSMIITTRDSNLGTDLADGEEPIDVMPFKPADAELLLQSKIAKHVWELTAARELLEVLGYIPLAITQAAAYVRQNKMSLKDYLKALRQSQHNLAQHLSKELLDPRRPRDTPSSVFLTWKLSFDQIYRDESRAAEMLSLMAFLDGQKIPEILLRRGELLDEKENSALGTLQAFSLITAGETRYDRDLSLQNSMERWQEKSLEILSNKLPSGEHENRQTFEALLPHALAVLKYGGSSNPSRLHRASILYDLASFDFAQGRYKSAFRNCEESYKERQRILGEGDAETLLSLTLLAATYEDQGLFEEAETLEIKALETSSEVLGPEHPDTLTRMSNLASTYMDQGRLKEAEELGVQVLETTLKVLGPEHPDTLTRMTNLAATYRGQERLKEAEKLVAQVLETSLKVLGPEHPDTLTRMTNLAATYRNQGRLKEAEKLGIRVLETSKKVLGLEHPSTLTRMNNLAVTYHFEGREEEAISLMEQTVEKRRAVLGPDHPNTLGSVESLEVMTQGLH